MEWWHQAKPGDRVVCVAAKFYLSADFCQRFGISMPSKGKIYTIRTIGPANKAATWSLLLNEIVNDGVVVEGIDVGEPCWPAIAFRPVVNRATDISALTALLSGAPSSSGLSRGSADLECVGAGVDPRHEAEDDGRKAGAR